MAAPRWRRPAGGAELLLCVDGRPLVCTIAAEQPALQHMFKLQCSASGMTFIVFLSRGCEANGRGRGDGKKQCTFNNESREMKM